MSATHRVLDKRGHAKPSRSHALPRSLLMAMGGELAVPSYCGCQGFHVCLHEEESVDEASAELAALL